MGDLKSRHRPGIPHCCPDCGGHWVGDGFTIPIHCENAELPLDREADAPPLRCGLPEYLFDIPEGPDDEEPPESFW